MFFFVYLHNSHSFQIVLGELQEVVLRTTFLGLFKNKNYCCLKNHKKSKLCQKVIIFKANRVSETVEQRKERLRIRHEKDRARRRTKKIQEAKKRSSETEEHVKQRPATLKRLK